MTTREQKLRKLVESWRSADYIGTSKRAREFLEIGRRHASELAAILNEEVEVSETMVERAWNAEITGGVHVWNFLLPTVTKRELSMIFRSSITAALKEAGK